MAAAIAGDLLHRGARGAVALAARQAIVQFLSLAAAIVLARVLTPAEFGVYGITVFLMQFLVVFSDAGLAAGLVREADEPDELDYRAVFTFQQVLVLGVAAVGLLLAPWMTPALAAGGELGLLLPALWLSLVIASFQTLPAARLERHLDFDRLAVVEVAQGIAFNGVVVACALAGLGANAMAAALVARAVAGAVVVQRVAPWPLGWNWDWSRVRPRLRFGLSFQGAAFVNLVRDALVPVFVGATLGGAAVGGIFFARMLAFYPFLIVYMLQRLLLPLFARAQDRPGELARAVELSLFAVAALVVPVQAIVLALAEPIVRIVFGAQWLASLPVYHWLWVAALLEPQLVIALALMNALGRAPRTLRFVATTTTMMWLVAVPLLTMIGPVGYGVALVLLLAVKWPLVVEADELSRVSSPAVVGPVWFAGLAAAAVAAVLARWAPPAGVASLAAILLAALAAYAALLLLVARERSGAALRWLQRQLAAAAGRESPAEGSPAAATNTGDSVERSEASE